MRFHFHLFPLSVYLLDWPGLGGFAEGISDLHSGDLAGKVGLLGLGRFEWWMLRSFVRWLSPRRRATKAHYLAWYIVYGCECPQNPCDEDAIKDVARGEKEKQEDSIYIFLGNVRLPCGLRRRRMMRRRRQSRAESTRTLQSFFLSLVTTNCSCACNICVNWGGGGRQEEQASGHYSHASTTVGCLVVAEVTEVAAAVCRLANVVGPRAIK